MMSSYVTTEVAADLTGRSARWIRQRVQNGSLHGEALEGTRSQGGITYQIPLDALPYEAQLRYYIMQANDGSVMNADLVGYRERHGEEGLAELLKRQRAVLAVMGMKEAEAMNLVEKVKGLAEELGTTYRTVYRWVKDYEGAGLSGLMRKGRKDAGGSRTMCLEARRFILNEYLNEKRRKQDAILAHLREHAKDMGFDACFECPFREGSENRDALKESGDITYYPACDQPGQGIIIPGHRSSINRLIGSVPDEVKTYIRDGCKPWKAAYMMKANRKKPERVNEVWFGDHHVFDLFVIDMDGKLVRPWLTAWYDMASGCLVGWNINLNPNSRTISQAFARAAVEKAGSPFKGLPVYCYVDNGKDYRCHALEGSRLREVSFGKVNEGLGVKPLYEAVRVNVIHAQAYHAWAKPIERWFGTLEDRYCRELPGYFGGDMKKRPENFERQLRAMHERGELMTLDEFSQHFIDQILPAYHTRPHEGDGYGGEKPLERYARLPMARTDIPSWEVMALAMEERTERTVSTQGIRFMNRLYWDADLRHSIGKEVTVRYDRDDMSSIAVLTKGGQFICVAPLKEYFQMVGEDEGKVARHVALQRRQEAEVREKLRSYGVKVPGKRASGNVYYEQIDTQFARGNYTDLEAERVARAKQAVAASRELKEEAADGEDMMREALLAQFDKTFGDQYARGLNG